MHNRQKKEQRDEVRFPAPGPSPLSEEQTERRRRNETLTVLAMLEMYCSKHHHGQEKRRLLPFGEYALCPKCAEKAAILIRQTSRCPHMAYKTFCHECPRPCHRPDPEIAAMMRYSGPRLMLRHPILAFRHLHYLLARRKVLRKVARDEQE